MTRSVLLAVAVVLAGFQVGCSDTIVSTALDAKPTPEPVTVTAESIVIPEGIVAQVHVTARDADGPWDRGLSLVSNGRELGVDGNTGEDDVFLVYGVSIGETTATVSAVGQWDHGTFDIPVRVVRQD